MVTAIVSALLCLDHYFSVGAPRSLRHLLYLAFSQLAWTLCWLEILLIMMNSPSAVYLAMPSLLVFMTAIVCLCHFRYLITSMGERLRFSPGHYIIPIVLTVGMAIWSNTVPFDERAQILFSTLPLNRDMSLFNIVYSLFPLSFSLYGIVYGVLSFRRAFRFRREIGNYAADEGRTSLNWIFMFLIGVCVAIFIPPFSVLSVNIGIPIWMHLFLLWIPPGVIYLTYNAIKGNYIIVKPHTHTEEDAAGRALTRHRFERYMAEKKPYLNPDLCITDMMTDLCTNRTYLSGFINKEYGMNFRTLINNYRLQELNRLRLEPTDKPRSSLELIKAAGFSSYNSYLASSEHKFKKNLLSNNARHD
jgi:AraC-like DNA-binding protein